MKENQIKPFRAREDYDDQQSLNAPAGQKKPSKGEVSRAARSSRCDVSATVGEESLCDQVQRLRQSTGLSTDELARLFGVTRRSVLNWVQGYRMSMRHQERMVELARVFEDLPGTIPEEKRDALFDSSQGLSVYHQLLKTVKRGQIMQFDPFTPLELLG